MPSLYEAYSSGQVKGCFYDAEGLKDFLRKAEHPLFGLAAADLAGSGEGKLSTPFRSVLKFDPQSYTERQRVGSCVAHGTRNAVDVSRAVEIDIGGEPEEWISRGAVEGIYGSRGHGGEGMSCAGAAKFVTSTGGLLLRRNYPEFGVDLSELNENPASRWGSSGLPKQLVALAKEHQVQTASMIRTVEEARDAIANGYGVNVCSGYGFSNVRDSFGVSPRKGSWSHSMAWSACDARPETVRKYGGPLFQVNQSWGSWNSGGHPDWGPLAFGAFLITAKDAQGMLNQNGAFAFSNVNGFPLRKLPDYGTASFL